MAEDYGYGYGRHRHEYDDAAEGYESGYDDEHDDVEDLDAADYEDYEDYDDDSVENDAPDWDDEPVGDRRFLTGAVDEPVDDVVEDPAANESPAYERIRRLKGSRRWRARNRRQGNWIPPDLREYGSPVFWPVGDPLEARRPGQGAPSWVSRDDILLEVLHQFLMTPLASCSELPRGMELELDERQVKEAARDLVKQGLLKSASFGCLMPPTPRYWVDPGDLDDGPVGELERAVVSWHRSDGVGCLLRYDMPRVEIINQVAVRYAVDGWALEGVAWVDREAVQAVALYNLRGSPEVRSTVSFMWVGQWDTEREIWERITDLPEAVGRITPPGIAGSVALIGADRWAVAGALPMAVEGLSAWRIEPADVAAWAYAGGWQAAGGASMLDGAAQPFTPNLTPVRLDRFVWPRAKRRLGRAGLDSIIKSCPWVRRDACTLFLILKLVGEYPGASIANYAALRGKSEKDRIIWRRMITLVDLGLAREAGIAGVANVRTSGRPLVFSNRGQGQMRYRVSLSPQGERELAEELAELGLAGGDPARPTADGAFRVMLDHGELSYREIVRRSGLRRLKDRLGTRRVHDDILVDLLGDFSLMGSEVVPASRARTVNAEGYGIDPDGLVYCCSPVGIGYHYLELELSHLGPEDVEARLRKYALRLTPYPLAVICRTDQGARNYDRLGQELGVPVVATSLLRLRKFGLAGPAWLHQGQEASLTPVPCPPRTATGPGPLSAP